MESQLHARILTIGGGKGGIGKTVVSANVGTVLAGQGKRVTLVDADLGAANLHLLLGIRYPDRNLSDFLTGKSPHLLDILLETDVPGASLISGASDVLGLANPKFSQKEKIFRELRKLDSDYIIIDLGAGTSYNTIDFFTLSQHGIIVIGSEPTSMENAYGFLKQSVLRKIQRIYSKERPVADLIRRASSPRDSNTIATISDLIAQIRNIADDNGKAAFDWVSQFQPRLIINRVKAKEDIDVALRFCDIAKKYLATQVVYVGYIAEDLAVQKAIRKTTTLTNAYPDSLASNCIKTITANLLELERLRQDIPESLVQHAKAS